MVIEDFAVGDKVVAEQDGQELNGTIESIQLKANLVDVKIFEPGHRSHCLIKSFAPNSLMVVDEHEPHDGSYAELQKRVEGEKSALLNQSIVDRLERIEDVISSLLTRVETLETKKKDEPNQDELLPGDSAASA